MYKEQAVHEPSLSRLKEIAVGLGLDVEETELQEYQRMLSNEVLLMNYNMLGGSLARVQP